MEKILGLSIFILITLLFFINFHLKIEENSNEWNKDIEEGATFWDVIVVNDEFILVGTNGDGLIVKIDKEGNEIWNKSFGIREATEQALAVQVIDENHYIIAGSRFYDRNSTLKGWVVKCADYSPPKIKVVKPKNFFYIFDREILPTETPIIVGDITVKCEDFNPMNRIDRVEFYLCLLDVKYEYIPRKIDYEPPYEWRWKTGMGFYELTVAAFYEDVVATVEKIDLLFIFNP
ncbi:MAG: hypothetical protein H5T45_06155 [Thermoplasmatales archaeon]|nr:hypothetical protein [Thermoplasmatales archaeon]